MINKPFDQSLYDANDNAAKKAVSQYLKKTHNVFVYEGDQYAADLIIANKDQIIAIIEVERRSNWIDNFPFDTVNVPFRKQKFFIRPFPPAYLFSVRQDLKMALYCDGKTIIESDVVLKDNKYMKQEPFFSVEIDKWTLVKLC